MKPKPRMQDFDLERARASSLELAQWIARHLSEDGTAEAAPGVFLSRFSSPTGPVFRVTEPSFCVIAQGTKEMVLGNERYRYDAFHYLLVSAGLPLVGQVIDASRERPYLGVRIVLDPAMITAVLIEAGLLDSPTDGAVRALAVSRLDTSLLDAVVRLVRLVSAPSDYGMLAPLITREIAYRLTVGEQGERLRQIAVSDAYSGANRPPIPVESGHAFRSNSARRSGPIRPLIPEQFGLGVVGVGELRVAGSHFVGRRRHSGTFSGATACHETGYRCERFWRSCGSDSMRG